MRLSEEQYKNIVTKKSAKPSKYKNKKVIYNGVKFDSAKERNYYLKLCLMQDAGLIRNLELQKKFVLQSSFKLNNRIRQKITYIADFYYFDIKNDKWVVVDVKGFKTEVYKLKKKLFEYKYGIEIEEV